MLPLTSPQQNSPYYRHRAPLTQIYGPDARPIQHHAHATPSLSTTSTSNQPSSSSQRTMLPPLSSSTAKPPTNNGSIPPHLAHLRYLPPSTPTPQPPGASYFPRTSSVQQQPPAPPRPRFPPPPLPPWEAGSTYRAPLPRSASRSAYQAAQCQLTEQPQLNFTMSACVQVLRDSNMFTCPEYTCTKIFSR